MGSGNGGTQGGGQLPGFVGHGRALQQGLAPDGGLMVPELWPRVTRPKLDAMRDLAYPQLAFEIIRFFADDFPGAELKAIIHQAYSAENFGSPEITPLVQLEQTVTSTSSAPPAATSVQRPNTRCAARSVSRSSCFRLTGA